MENYKNPHQIELETTVHLYIKVTLEMCELNRNLVQFCLQIMVHNFNLAMQPD